MKNRLQEALVLLGCGAETQPLYKSNLLHAIALFAGLHGDAELEKACELEIEKIRNASTKTTLSHGAVKALGPAFLGEIESQD